MFSVEWSLESLFLFKNRKKKRVLGSVTATQNMAGNRSLCCLPGHRENPQGLVASARAGHKF